jgi:hypothetical protein
VIQIQKECKLEIDVEEYADSFKPFLMDVLYNWSKVDVSLAILTFVSALQILDRNDMFHQRICSS